MAAVAGALRSGSVGRVCRLGRTAALLALLLAALGAAAQGANDAPPGADGQLRMQVALGFSEVFRLGRWTPLTVTLANHGDDLVGQLDVEVGGGYEFQDTLFTTVQRRRVELPRNSQKRFRYTVFLEKPSTPLTVRVTAGGGQIVQRRIDLRGRSSAGRLVLVLSRDADLDYLNDGSVEGLRVLYPHPELLPERWQGYDGVDALIIHGVSLERLSDRQFEALKRWLAAGGVCVISGGPDYALLHTPRLAGLLPGAPVGVAQVSAAAKLRGSTGTLADSLFSDIPRPFDVNRLARFRGRVLYRADQLPLVIEQGRGRGRVLYLTFDIARAPFSHWAGMRGLWSASLRLPPPPIESLQADSLVADVIREQPKGVPGHGAVFVFLALYLGILASVYRLALSDMARRSLPWLCWSMPLAFAPIGYFLFGPAFFPQGTTMIALATIEPIADSPYGRLRLDLGVYANRGSDLRFDYAGAEPVLLPVRRTTPATAARPGSAQSESTPARVERWVLYEDERALRPLDRRRYVLHLLRGYDLVADDLAGSVTQTDTGLRLWLRTDPGRALRDAWLIVGRHAYPLGALAAGAELTRDFNAELDALGVRDIVRQRTQTGADPGIFTRRAEKTLLNNLLEEVGKQEKHRQGALLFGFSSGPLRLSDAGSTARRRVVAATLVHARLPLVAAGGVDHETD